MTDPSPCLFMGAVALELVPGTQPARLRLGPAAAGSVGDGIANDLARLHADAATLDLALAGALFDPAELLRPGWPVHTALAALAARAPGERGGRVLGFGAKDSRMPDPALEPASELAGGPLRLLPWLLSGPEAAIAGAGTMLEEVLLERGMVEAASALALQEAFGAGLEHVRLLSIHDLCALTAAQYRHASLDGAWAVIETALLRPADTVASRSDGPPVAWHAGTALLGTLDRAAWQASGLAPSADAERAFRYWQMRERQLAAVFAAHGLPVQAIALPKVDAALAP